MRILAILYTVVFVMTLLVSMGLMVFGDMLYEWLITVMPPAFPTLINRFKPIMSYVLLLFFFWLMFIAIPRKQVSRATRFSAQRWLLPGGSYSRLSSPFSWRTSQTTPPSTAALPLWSF